MRQILFTAILMTLTCFYACKKPEVSQAPSTNITGSVSLFDENNKLITDNSKTVVSVENSNPVISVMVNNKGEYQLPKLNKQGIVSLIFSNDGFGTLKQYYAPTAIDSIEKDLTSLQGASLYKKSSVVVNSLTGTVEGDMFKMVCNVSVSNQNSLNAIRFFIQKNNENVSTDNCLNSNNVSHTFPVLNGNNTISICMKCEEQCGFHPGDTAFLKAYGDIGVENSYVDLSANKLIFPSVNLDSKSSILWFVVP